MKTLTRAALLAAILALITACAFSSTPQEQAVDSVSLAQVTLATPTLGSGTPQAGSITLSKTATPTTFTQAGQVITFNYTLTNAGTSDIGPVQFQVLDDHIATPILCGNPGTTLSPAESIQCTGLYIITAGDVTAGSVTSYATASAPGLPSSPQAGTTLMLAGAGTGATPATSTLPVSSGAYTKGTTIQYKVIEGEWLIQIGRCFGADPAAIARSNPTIIDPDEISPDQVLTIPNIGSNGTIYGPPCITFHTVQSGDTWASIASRYNADVVVMQAANRGAALAAGTKVRVPLNSAGSVPATGPTQSGVTPVVTACNQAQMVADVNMPDNTTVSAGANFTKTWRLKNVGTCTWTSAYQLAFDHGEAMGAPAASALTTVNVAPGSTVDVSIGLKAPLNPGTYQGDFKLRAADGTSFGIGATGQSTFWVKIIVPGTGTIVVPTTPVVTPITPVATTPVVGTPQLVALLGKQVTGSVELATFIAANTDGPCLETQAGSGVLECRTQNHEVPFVRLEISNPADPAHSTIKGVRIFPRYLDALPEGLTWLMNKQQVEAKLGAPVGIPTETGSGLIEVEYRSSNPAYRLWAVFNAADGQAALMNRMRIAVP